LNDALIQKTKALLLKDEFIRNLSHEVRTPLTGIVSVGSYLASNWDSMKEHLKKETSMLVSQNGQRLLSLMNNLLDLSRLTTGKQEYKIEKINIKTLVEEIINIEMPMYMNEDLTQNFSFSLDTSNLTNEYINIDKEKITQVIRNLYINSIRFMERIKRSGSIDARIEDYDILISEINPTKEISRVSPLRSYKHSLAHGSPKISSVEFNLGNSIGANQQISKKGILFSIRDEGPGIPEEEKEDIFMSFFQSSRTKTGAGGTGLGLSIAKEITDAHKGKIWVENIIEENTKENGRENTKEEQNLIDYTTQEIEVTEKDNGEDNYEDKYEDNYKDNDEDNYDYDRFKPTSLLDKRIKGCIFYLWLPR
ncbi:MAG: HAMP domain-containing sensor histidine kinase, partial [Rickettsiaceae bacterium]|nr:HAMP domain-containing sensor histidine kinase [Rickettsiaceae bacterium]